jgi:phosphoglycerate kinase
VGEAGIGDGMMALDIGPKSAALFAEEIRKAKTVVWNGPMGLFEKKPFAEGTMTVAKAIASTPCLSVVGGGDSVSAVNQSGVAGRISHISTGGGASLEFLEGKVLPGVASLSDR